jgi:phospholipase C
MVVTTKQNWGVNAPRVLAHLAQGDQGASVIGFGVDGVWTLKRSRAEFIDPSGEIINHDSSAGDTGPILHFVEPQLGVVGFEWNAGWQVGSHPRVAIDLTGDGNVDLVGFGHAGVWTALGDGTGKFAPMRFVVDEMSSSRGWNADYPRFVVDITGDGRPDVVGFGRQGIWVARSIGDGTFGTAQMVSTEFSADNGWQAALHPRLIADVIGDGRGDAVGFGQDGVWVAGADGSGGFQAARFVLQDFGFNQGWRTEEHLRLLADLNGKGASDIVGFGNDGVLTALATGDGGFGPTVFGGPELAYNQGWRLDRHPRFVADLTGDGRGDLIGFGDDGVWTALGNGDGTFQPAQMVINDFGWNQGWRIAEHPRQLVDTTGDGKLDIVGFGNDGIWVSLGKGDGTFAPPTVIMSDFGRDTNVDRIVNRQIVRDHRHPGRIKHLFVLMLENRSFDHLLGFAELSGPDAATGQPAVADGLTGREFNTYQGKIYPVIRGAPDVTKGPAHGFLDAVEQLSGRAAKFDGDAPYPAINNSGFVSKHATHQPDVDPGEVMRCFLPEHLPVLTTLAREFAVCDRWFSSIPGPTEPNRYFASAASSAEHDESPSAAEIFRASNNPFGGVRFRGGNIFGACDDADVKTRIYCGNHFAVVGQMDGVSNLQDVKNFGGFAEYVQDPNFNASYIHIEPRYFDGLGDTTHADFSGGNSQHPSGGGVAAGEKLIKKVYETIRNSPHWESSMLVITYDEHGGFYDHVPPGPAAPSNSVGEEHGFRFNQLGARVPAVIISPFVPQGTIEHRLLEHSSIVKTVCELFEVPLLRGNRDLKTVCGFGHLASLPAARTDTPERLPDAVVAPFPNVGHATDLHRDFEMLQLSLRLAALHDAELRPGDREAIERRVAALQTPEDAAVYVNEVNERIGALEPT